MAKKHGIKQMWKNLQEGECGQDAKEGGQGQNQKYHAGVLHSHHHPKIYQNDQNKTAV